MNPVFTLNYPELLLSNQLQTLFPKSNGYSTLIPLSSQQKGYDIALMHRTVAGSKVATFQVKSSRTYAGSAGVTPRSKVRSFNHYMWLKSFKVPAEADFFLLFGLYSPNPSSLKSTLNVWRSHVLLFTHAELTKLMGSIRQKTSNKPDAHFGFGFDNSEEAFLTRGHADSTHPDYSHHVLSKRKYVIEGALAV